MRLPDNAHGLELGGVLMSWGSGRDGRLGHDDYRDRWDPTVVEPLAHGVVKVSHESLIHTNFLLLRPSLAVIEGICSWGCALLGCSGIDSPRSERRGGRC